MAVEHQIAVLYCGTRGLMRDIAIEQVADFERELLRELDSTNVYEKLREGVIDDEVTARIEKAAERVTAQLKA